MYNPDSACVNLRSTGFIDLKKQNSEIRFSYQQSQRPLSPAPERSQFETDADFLRERERWFQEHGDGAVLRGETRREQNTVFQRLKDRLFGLRRGRANPCGTPRALQGAQRSELHMSEDRQSSAE